ncbi:MAG: OmpA family protein [Deltaproteobacteria bacterium]|nr:MAG: OmpA family protein [Deltaproteobacteria bacterium]
MLSSRSGSQRRIAIQVAVAGLCAALGCETQTGTALDKKSTQGAILGGLAGAAAGRAIGGHEHDTAGILIGAASGAVAGGLIGHYLDKQAQEIDAIPDANVEQRGDVLVVGFQGDVMFDSGSSVLHAGAYSRLEALADTLERYPASDVIVKGHTDAEGGEQYNLRLSQDRADHVRAVLVAEGVRPSRISAIGLGEAFPVASNDTAVGRQQNRRVEIEIRPREDEIRE